jgi:hypothetical protein
MHISDYKETIVGYLAKHSGTTSIDVATALLDEIPYSQRHIRRYVASIRAIEPSLNGKLKHPIDFNSTTPDRKLYYTGTPFNGTVLKSYMEKKIQEQGYYDVLFQSDAHGWLCDLTAQRAINLVLADNKFDEVCLNGDMIDLPYISAHTRKLYEDGILNGYSEVREVEYTRDQILIPMRAATDAKIRFRLGNHDIRITKPNLLGKGQLARLAILYKHFETTQLDEMLSLDELRIDYDDSDIFSYFGVFDCTHGLSLAKNAQEANMNQYHCSGTSGHSHRLGVKYMTKRKGTIAWFESGCTRLTEQVEYMPTGIIPDWAQGFVTVRFYYADGKIKYSGQSHFINDGRVLYNGKIYDGRSQKTVTKKKPFILANQFVN